MKSAVLLAGLGRAAKTTVRRAVATRDHTELMLEAAGAKRDAAAGVGHARAAGARCSLPEVAGAGRHLLGGAVPRRSRRCSRARTLTVHDVGLNPRRTGLLDVLERMGARVGIHNKRRVAGELVGDIEIGAQPLVATRIGAAEVPRLVDELPLVALLGSLRARHAPR